LKNYSDTYSKVINLTNSILQNKIKTQNLTNFSSYEADTFVSQMYPFNQRNILNEYSEKNNISSIDYISCYLDSEEDLYINKLEFQDSQTNTTPIRLTFSLWKKNSTSINKICENSTSIVSLPIPNGTYIYKNKDTIIDFQRKGINLMDISDPFFNDRCFKYEEESKKEYTILQRRKYYFFSQSLTCSHGCFFIGINENGYIKCNCSDSNNISLIINPYSFTNSSSPLNWDVIKCMSKVVKNVKSIL
jgi:hypothetical protein